MRKWDLASCSLSPKTAIVFSPRLRAPAKVRFSTVDSPRPTSHDADLYRLYQKAAEKIEGQGGRNPRVVLDYEMKKRLYRDLAKLGPGRVSSEQKHLVAERHGLQVVRGKIPVPDIRIEYQARDGERARVDLELATSHYRGRSLAEKVRAGFSSTPTGRMLRSSGGCWISVN